MRLELGSLERALKRGLIARMGHGGRKRPERSRRRDQAPVFFVLTQRSGKFGHGLSHLAITDITQERGEASTYPLATPYLPVLILKRAGHSFNRDLGTERHL